MRIILSFPLLLALAGCSGQAETVAAAPLVRLFQVGATGSDGQSLELTGTVAARVESDLAFREFGRIVERRVDNGSVVTAGTLLARIDSADLAENVSASRMQALSARRAVDALRATAEGARADERRLRGLVEAGAISRKNYDDAVEEMRAATARLAAAEAEAAGATANARVQSNRRSYAELRAPTAGVVTAVLADAGQVVAAGAPVIRLAAAGPREVEVDIPEQMRGSVPRTGQGAVYAGGQLTLVLREIAGAADPATRTYRARYRVLTGNPPLGATVTLRFANEAKKGLVTVPIASLTERGGGPGVWVVGRDSKVTWQKVTLGNVTGERAAVTGLSPGARIVALGAHLLQPGQSVRTAGASPTSLASR
jgi:RND family efflux transporter MFP subunit